MAQTERLQIEVSENGAKTVKRNIEDIGTAAQKAGGAVDVLKSALAGLTIAGIVKITDEYAILTNRIRGVTATTGQASAVMQELYGIATRARSGVQGVAEAFFTMEIALAKQGKTQRDVLNITETITKAFVAFGASSEGAERAIVQLGQGFSKGKLQTQDYKAIAEQVPGFAALIAKNIEIPGFTAEQVQAKFLDLVEAGKVTSERMAKAFEKMRGEIDTKFGTSLKTVGQGITVFRDQFVKVAGEVAQQTGFTDALSSALLYLAQNMDTVVRAAGAAALVFGTGLGLAAVVKLFQLLGTIMLAHPLIRLATIAAGALAALTTFGDKVGVVGTQFSTVRDVANVLWEDIKAGSAKAFKVLSDNSSNSGRIARSALGGITDFLVNLGKAAIFGASVLYSAYVAAIETIIQKFSILPSAFLDIAKLAANGFTDVIANMINAATGYLASGLNNLIGKQVFSGSQLEGLKLQAGTAGAEVGTAFTDNFNKNMQKVQEGLKTVSDYFKDVGKRSDELAAKRIENEKKVADAQKAAAATIDQARPDQRPAIDGKLQAHLNDLQREIDILKLVGDQYTIGKELIAAYKLKGDELNETERTAITNKIALKIELERQQQLVQGIVGPTNDYNNAIKSLSAALSDGRINLEQYNRAMAEQELAFLKTKEATTFAQGFTQQLRIMQLETRNATGQMGKDFAQIFGPGGSLSKGIGDAVAQALVFGKNWKDAIRGVAQQILGQLISAIVQTGINMALNFALGQTLQAAGTASGVAQAGVLTAAYAPAAATASIATGGAAAAAGSAGISSVFSLLASLLGGFSDGGYTGGAAKNAIAGVVHGQEYVINANATKKYRSTLESINAGKDPAALISQPPAQAVNLSIRNEIPDAAYETRILDENAVEIIARRIVRRESSDVLASELRNPNSRASKAISGNTTATRRR